MPKPDHVLVLTVAIRKHGRCVTTGDLDNATDRMGVKGREEFLSFRIGCVLESAREFRPVKTKSHDHVPRLDIDVRIEIPGKEGPELRILLEKRLNRRIYLCRLRTFFGPARQDSLNAAIEKLLCLAPKESR